MESLAEFVDAVSEHPTPEWMFRGQARISDPLIPLLQRPGLCPAGVDLEAFERDLIDQFQREAWAHLGNLASELTEWEWLAIAQHYGLPTRLLDWTQNAGAALFFAVEDAASGEDSAVYCYRDPGERDRPRAPFSVQKVCVYHPPHIAGRFISQRGCFTAHPLDFAQHPRWESELIRVTIPAECRDDIREGLRTLGIDRASLFPGLEGIAHSIRARMCGIPGRASCTATGEPERPANGRIT